MLHGTEAPAGKKPLPEAVAVAGAVFEKPHPVYDQMGDAADPLPTPQICPLPQELLLNCEKVQVLPADAQ